MNMNEIEQLRAEVAALRDAAEKADAQLAFLLGTVFGAMEYNVDMKSLQLDPKSILTADTAKGWQATMSERLSAGRAIMLRHRRKS